MSSAHLLESASAYHRALPDRIRKYLNRRGIPDAVIDLYLLGWNGERITVPIRDREGQVLFFKLAKDPEDPSPSPKMLTPPGCFAELYGWERLGTKPCKIVICEGEFDRLVLEAQGFPAVTSTGGAGVFKKDWVEHFAEIPEVFVCFDRDEAGRRGALQVGQLISHAKIVELPEEVGPGGDVTDFFLRLRKTRDDFSALLETAKPFLEERPPERRKQTPAANPPRPSTEVTRIKERIRIEALVSQYVTLRKSGASYKGLCPFHEDHNPSFVVYPASQTFHCFGCHLHGDVVSFLMRIELLTFPEAVQVLQRMSS